LDAVSRLAWWRAVDLGDPVVPVDRKDDSSHALAGEPAEKVSRLHQRKTEFLLLLRENVRV
jgi:hypothetical protein